MNLKVGSLLIFPLSPITSMLIAFFSGEKIGIKLTVTLMFSLLGYQVPADGDLERYKDWFYDVQGLGFVDVLHRYGNLEIADVYTELMSVFVGLFIVSHHVYFAVLFGIFGYLLISIVQWFVDNNDFKIKNNQFYLLLFAFAFYYSIRSLYSIRFYTGTLFAILFILKFISTDNKKFLVISALAPTIHFSLLALVMGIVLFFFFRNRIFILFSLVVISFFVGQTKIMSLFQNSSEIYENNALEGRYKAYVDEDGRKRLDEHYENRSLAYNWKASSLELVRNLLFYCAMCVSLVLFFFRKKIINTQTTLWLYSFVLALFVMCNLMSNINNGVRFQVPFVFVSLGLVFLLFFRIKNKILKKSLLIFSVLGLIQGIMSYYAANGMFTFAFFTSNFATFFFEIFKMS